MDPNMSNNLMLDVPPMLFSSPHSLFIVPMLATPEQLLALKEKQKNSAKIISLKIRKKLIESQKLEELSLLEESMVDSISVEPLVMESTKKTTLYLLKSK